MAGPVSFTAEIRHALYALTPNPVEACIQCGTCSASCPLADFMDHSPRQLIAMIRAGQRRAVLASNTFWICASCYQCTVRCPAEIDVARMMYALKRYAIWRNQCEREAVTRDFSRRFMRMVVRTGRSWEPALAPAYLGRRGLRGVLDEARVAAGLLWHGRLPLWPRRIRRRQALRRVLRHIVPVGGRS
ncbi:MAG: 4Fe-4S dicluster domain-containing protein [Armatimonadota bacterium]|nr:4Fe-4S dicluster domain-containing protein [Armatimonadota bacterium]MDR7450496.1 4Fe-4S dicluster domain-containing protein [Armatimonadota bacterium]MDR7466370.1 4Fe-4S dicluster domain-containing protein [Armatimonadota bacterium]MDR7493092.1 4Fe-4S dicluster domain-containing protein [Armatimonadota bacterium]MDR7498151.1 4Fe-4S dicluster domain-containing protein [Armatimonadota bacterium]